MLIRLRHAGCSLAHTVNRGYTSNSSPVYPLKKLRAFLFQMSPEGAQRLMAEEAHRLCGGKYWLRSRFVKYIPPESEAYKIFDFKYKRPTSFAAAYFPCWIISGHFNFDARYPDGRTGTIFYITHFSYMPGSDAPVLSAASLFPLNAGVSYPVPFSEKLLKQQGMDVDPIPFNVSPFSCLDLLRNPSNDDIAFVNGASVHPSKISVGDFTAMPILIPIYIGTYEDERMGSGKKLTLFIQAMTEEGDLKADQQQVLDLLSLNKYTKETVPKHYSLIEGHDVCDIDGFKERTFGNLKFVIGKSSWDLEFRHHDIELKLMEYFSKTENVQKLAEMRKVENDDDERIQPFTSSQIRALDAWSKSKSEALDKVLTYDSNAPKRPVSKKNIWAKYSPTQTKKGVKG